MANLTKEEIVEIFVGFLNEVGMYEVFKDNIERQGYTLDELGIPEE